VEYRVEKLGYSVPKFDFRLQGVTSISADIHKYGFGCKVSDRTIDLLQAHVGIRMMLKMCMTALDVFVETATAFDLIKKII